MIHFMAVVSSAQYRSHRDSVSSSVRTRGCNHPSSALWVISHGLQADVVDASLCPGSHQREMRAVFQSYFWSQGQRLFCHCMFRISYVACMLRDYSGGKVTSTWTGCDGKERSWMVKARVWERKAGSSRREKVNGLLIEGKWSWTDWL